MEYLQGFFTQSVQESFLIIAFTVIVALLARRALGIVKRSERSNEWLVSLCRVLYGPIMWIIGGYGVLTAAAPFLEGRDGLFSSLLLFQLRDVLLIGAITWVVLRWKSRCRKVFLERNKERGENRFDEALIFALGKLISILILSIAFMLMLEVFDVPLQVFLTFGGIGGLAVSWAAKDVIANFFGGLMIYINRPFAVGEWVKAKNKSFEGVVEDIGWYNTRLRSFERRPTYIPNAIFLDAILENPGRMYNRRIKTLVGVRYEDIRAVKSITEGIEKMLREHPDIDQEQALLVHLVAFGPSSLDIEVYTFTKTTVWKEFRQVQQDVFLKIADVVESYEAEIAFPTQTLYVQKGSSTLAE